MKLLLTVLIFFCTMAVQAAPKVHPLPGIPDEKAKAYHEAALLCADWMVRNQVRDWGDANQGRFIGGYHVETGDLSYSINWPTAASVMGLLMTYHRTGEDSYREAATRAGMYLKSLQILDPRQPRHYGYLRENTPQTTWGYPRDALTGVWGMLWLYEETGDEEYLRRVRLFNDWFLREGMARGWPLWEVNMRGEPYKNLGIEGSFHGGDVAYFYDYWRITGDDSYSERGIRYLADYFVEHFIDENGRVHVVRDRETGEYRTDDNPQYPAHWVTMHEYNDDFATIGLLGAWLRYGDDVYLDRVRAFADRMIDHQNPAGSFHDPYVPPASATVPILLLDLYRLTGERKYFDAAHRAGEHLLTLQETESDDGKARGGFHGYSGKKPDSREYINLRTTSYALIALWKLEGKEAGPYYSVFTREGELPGELE